jgi:two-component system, chemotaxis family, sensor kinase CheA
MDVVKRNIQKMGGRVNVRSEPGKGAAFILTLPLTLAVLDGMIVRCGDDSYVIPISNIIECRASWAGDAGVLPGSSDVLNVRGNYVKLVRLNRALGVAGERNSADQVAIIAEIEGGEHVALVVDEIVGQQQVVIKSMNNSPDPLPGVAGATILGDGRVALILDLTEIAKLRTAGRRRGAGNGRHAA